jgi:transposase-like protein
VQLLIKEALDDRDDRRSGYSAVAKKRTSASTPEAWTPSWSPGYDKHDPAGKDGGNSSNGTRTKTVLTDVGPVEITVPRDRDASFEPQIVKKRQQRLTGVEDMVLSLSAKGLTTGEISDEQRFLEFAETWGLKYPAIVRLWENAWAKFVPFLSFDTEIRKVVCSTNAIESVNARIRRAVRARGHFPNEQAALKCVYLAVALDPTGTGRRRWINRWKPALNAFDLAFYGRLTTGRN